MSTERKFVVTGTPGVLASVAMRARQLRLAYEIDENDDEKFVVWADTTTAEHDALVTFMDASGATYE